jgi:hypothetical protein
MPTEKRTFYALLVGIDRYKNPAIPSLHGCVNDVEAIRRLLLDRFQVPPAHILALTNQQATRAEILRAFREHLIQYARYAPDAEFLYYYSGHGSQARNPAKPEGVDETTVPHDSRSEDIYDLRDWELGELLDELTAHAKNLTVILDCCHSGSGTRGPDTRPAEPGVRRCPADLREQAGLPRPKTVATRAGRGEFPYVLLAACQNYQKAHEYGEPPNVHGALTYHFLQALAEMPLTYQALHEKLKLPLRRLYRDQQIPKCEGEGRKREVFGGLRGQENFSFIVSEKRGGFFWLEAGLAHGLSLGGELNVYPLGAGDFTGEAKIAALKIRQLGGTRSACTLLDGQADFALPANAVLYRRSARHGVWLNLADARLREDWRGRIEQGEFAAELELATCPEQADFQVVESAEGLAVLDRLGREVIAARPKMFANPLLPGMRHIARYLNALALRHQDADSPLAGSLSLALKKGDLASPPLQDGLPVFQAGEPMAVEIANHGDQPWYFVLLQFNQDWSIQQLYPLLRGGHERLAARHIFVHGMSAGQAAPATGVIKAIASQQPADLAHFEQGSLQDALDGKTARRGEKPAQADDWACARIMYRIVR